MTRSTIFRHLARLALPLLGSLSVGACSSGNPEPSQGAGEAEATAETSSALTGAPTKALILVDSQLYSKLSTELTKYRDLAELRRGFSIALQSVQGLDAKTPAQVRDYVIQQRAATPTIEGVLFVGNVKLPSFYKTRNDVVLTRIWPIYLQDLDASFGKHYSDGQVDPVCNGSNEPFCVVSPRADGSSGPITVPRHDFDQMTRGANPDPEIWASFMPVGVSGTSNTYTDFANQLKPYLNKVISYYQGQLTPNGRYYLVGNDKGETFDITWNTFGKSKIDFYGKPGPQDQTGSACISGTTNYCYTRWSTESYADYASFASAWGRLWVGEGWQTDSIFMNHMNSALYDVAEVNVHSADTFSLVTASQAKTITKAGLIVTLDGCGVGGYAQPGSPSNVDDPFTLPSDNIMASYLYGSSKAIAALGDPHWRGHYAHYPTMYSALKTGAKYLGAANLDRMKRLYSLAGNDSDLKEQVGELLMGDPFMDLSPAACTAESNTAFCSRLGKNCGSVTANDNCGVSRTVSSCGSCTSPQTCGGGGTATVCGTASCTPESNAQFCSRLGKNCGSVTANDNCGVSRTVSSCGSCTSPQTCGGGGTANVCGGGTTTCAPAYDQQHCQNVSPLYGTGSKVSRNGHNYTCTNDNCRNCSWVTECEPGNTGCPWGAVWADNGTCQ